MTVQTEVKSLSEVTRGLDMRIGKIYEQVDAAEELLSAILEARMEHRLTAELQDSCLQSLVQQACHMLTGLTAAANDVSETYSELARATNLLEAQSAIECATNLLK